MFGNFGLIYFDGHVLFRDCRPFPHRYESERGKDSLDS